MMSLAFIPLSASKVSPFLALSGNQRRQAVMDLHLAHRRDRHKNGVPCVCAPVRALHFIFDFILQQMKFVSHECTLFREGPPTNSELLVERLPWLNTCYRCSILFLKRRRVKLRSGKRLTSDQLSHLFCHERQRDIAHLSSQTKLLICMY